MNYISNDSLFEDERIKIESKYIEGNKVFIELYMEPKEYYECPFCASNNIVKNGHDYRYPTIEIMPHFINVVRFKIQRFKCARCGKSFYDENKLTLKGERISKSTKFEILYDLKRDVSFTYIARKNNVSVDTVIDVFRKYVYPKKYKLSETICIDEFKNLKSAKGKYAFLIFDPINSKIIEVLESRLVRDIDKYFYSVGFDERENVRYVVSDMNDNYRYLVSKYFPRATYIVDAFHYLRYIEDAFNKVRIRVMNKFDSKDPRYKMLKRYWKILSSLSIELNTNNLFNYIKGYETDTFEIIRDSLLIDSELDDAYNITQIFLRSVKFTKYEDASSFLDKWIEELNSSNIPEFSLLSPMFKRWKIEIVNSFIRFGDKRLSNGPIEGMNNHIKEIKRIAFGYRNFNDFRKRILYIINEEPPSKI